MVTYFLDNYKKKTHNTSCLLENQIQTVIGARDVQRSRIQSTQSALDALVHTTHVRGVIEGEARQLRYWHVKAC